MTAEAATDGITVATIRVEADAMRAAHGVKAEDLGTKAIPDKVVEARMEMAAEIDAIAPLVISRLTPELEAARAILIKAKTVAIAIRIGPGTKGIVTGTGIVTRIKTRIKTRTGIVIRAETKTKIVTRTKIGIVTGIVTRTGTKTRIETATGIATKTRIKIETRTEIAGAVVTIAAIADTVAILSTTTQLLMNLGITATMLTAEAPMTRVIKTACTQVPTMVVAGNPSIPNVHTFSGMDTTDTARSLAVEIPTNRPIAMVSCEATRKALRIGKGISLGAFSTHSSSCVGQSVWRSNANQFKHTRNRAKPKT